MRRSRRRVPTAAESRSGRGAVDGLTVASSTAAISAQSTRSWLRRFALPVQWGYVATVSLRSQRNSERVQTGDGTKRGTCLPPEHGILEIRASGDFADGVLILETRRMGAIFIR